MTLFVTFEFASASAAVGASKAARARQLVVSDVADIRVRTFGGVEVVDFDHPSNGFVVETPTGRMYIDAGSNRIVSVMEASESDVE